MPSLPSKIKRERKKLFVAAYFAHQFNGRAAAISVGVPIGSAASQASTWMRQDEVIAMMNEKWESLKIEHSMTLNAAIAEMGYVGRSNIAHYLKRDEVTGKVEVDKEGQVQVDFTQTTNDQFAAVAEISVHERVIKVTRDEEEGSTSSTVSRKTTVKMHDKIGAMDKLIRIFGGYEGKEQPIITNNDNRTQVLVADGGSVVISQEDAADAYRKMLNP